MDAQLDALRKRLTDLGSVVVAFSGGIDSALVLKVATDALGARALGLTAVGPSLPERERLAAHDIADAIGARHLWRESHESTDPRYRANPTNRCYYCKTELYRLAEQVRREHGLDWIVNGTNADDLGDHRPGLDAAAEARVRSPLAETGCTKADVRRLARLLEMREWDKPASACLASRIPYGTEVTEGRLKQVEQFENALRDLGFQVVRVRHHGTVARVEMAPNAFQRALGQRDELLRAGKQAGFLYVSLDLAGYRMGSLNEVIPSEVVARRSARDH